MNFESDDVSLEIYLGFKLDGLNKFENLSAVENLTQFGKLDLYTSPTVHVLGDGDVITFVKGEPLIIKASVLTKPF